MNLQVRPNDITQYDNFNFIHPWEYLTGLGNANRTIVQRAEGIYLYDPDGNELIDGPGGMWCVQIGHGRQEMADAIRDQVLRMTYNTPWGLTSEPAPLLANRIAQLTPGDLNHVFFTTGGSTAVDSAMRFIAFYNNFKGRPNKKKIISRHNAYHGSTYLSASASGKERDKNYFDFATHIVHHISAPNPYRKPEGMTEEQFLDWLIQEFEDKVLELGPDNVAAFIAEPILASGGVIVPPTGYHKRMLEICRKYDMLYISDEVVTAFGRLGHWFASEEVFDIVPDMITCAKGLTSGYVPMGACIISERLIGEISGPSAKDSIFSNGYTYSGHPVAAAAALKNMEIMEREGILEHVQRVGPYFQSRLAELNDLPIVGNVRGMGLMGCVECVTSKDSKEALKLDKDIGVRIDRHCQALGLVVRPNINMNVMSPPLTITEPQIDKMVEILREGITRAMNEVRQEGLWNG